MTKTDCVVNGRHPYVGNGELQVLAATGVVLVVEVVDVDNVVVFIVVGAGAATLPAGTEELEDVGFGALPSTGLPAATVVVLVCEVVDEEEEEGTCVWSTGRPASVPDTPSVSSKVEICIFLLG